MNEDPTQTSSSIGALLGSIGAAIGAAICCLGPLVLVSLGASGAWIGQLSALEPFRPMFMLGAVGLLGFSFYQIYGRPSQTQCKEGDVCEASRTGRINRITLWIAALLIASSFAAPYLLDINAEEASAQAPSERSPMSSQVTLSISGMTCAGCTHTVQQALEDIEGVRRASVTLDPARAIVTYDHNKVTRDQLLSATSAAGYPSKLTE